MHPEVTNTTKGGSLLSLHHTTTCFQHIHTYSLSPNQSSSKKKKAIWLQLTYVILEISCLARAEMKGTTWPWCKKTRVSGCTTSCFWLTTSPISQATEDVIGYMRGEGRKLKLHGSGIKWEYGGGGLPTHIINYHFNDTLIIKNAGRIMFLNILPT